MKLLTASSFAVLFLTSGAAAARAAGGEAFDFLLFDASVRAAGLGGAYTALASDSSALFYNPAGLGRIETSEAALMHNQYVEGLTQEYVGFASRRGWGANLNYLDFGGVPRTRLDARDGGVGRTGLTDLALGGGFGRALSKSISVGAGAKFIRETIDGASAGGLAVDAGVLAAVPSLPGLSLGAALLNAGPGVRFQSRTESLPLLGRAGAAYAFRAGKTDNTAAFDLIKGRTDEVRFGLGAETVISKVLALRLGFTTRSDAGIGLAGGVGFLWKALGVDFAFTPFGDLGFVNRLSLTFRWGREAKRAAPLAKTIVPPAPRLTPPPAHEAPPMERKQAALKDALAAVEDASLRLVVHNERLGRSEFADCNYAKAKNFFAQAIRAAYSARVKDPVIGDAYAGMGRCLLEEGNIGDAAKFFKAAEAGPSPETRRLVEEELETLRLP